MGSLNPPKVIWSPNAIKQSHSWYKSCINMWYLNQSTPAKLAYVFSPADCWSVNPPNVLIWPAMVKTQKFKNPGLCTFAGFCELLRVFCELLRVFCVRFFQWILDDFSMLSPKTCNDTPNHWENQGLDTMLGFYCWNPKILWHQLLKLLPKKAKELELLNLSV